MGPRDGFDLWRGETFLAYIGFRTLDSPVCSLLFTTTALRFQILPLSKIRQDKLWLTRFSVTLLQNYLFPKNRFRFWYGKSKRILWTPDKPRTSTLPPPRSKKSLNVQRAELYLVQVGYRLLHSIFNPLKSNGRLLYLKTQFVPRSKHFSSRL